MSSEKLLNSPPGCQLAMSEPLNSYASSFSIQMVNKCSMLLTHKRANLFAAASP